MHDSGRGQRSVGFQPTVNVRLYAPCSYSSIYDVPNRCFLSEVVETCSSISKHLLFLLDGKESAVMPAALFTLLRGTRIEVRCVCSGRLIAWYMAEGTAPDAVTSRGRSRPSLLGGSHSVPTISYTCWQCWETLSFCNGEWKLVGTPTGVRNEHAKWHCPSRFLHSLKV